MDRTYRETAPAVRGIEAPRMDRRRLALVHIAKARIGMADEAYRAMLRATADVDSAIDLNEAGFRAVMKRFEELGFVQHRTHTSSAPDTRRPGMATQAQCDYIRGMWRQWSGADDPRALGRWLEHRFHVSALRFADVVTAQKAIEGLRAMLARDITQQARASHNGGRRRNPK